MAKGYLFAVVMIAVVSCSTDTQDRSAEALFEPTPTSATAMPTRRPATVVPVVVTPTVEQGKSDPVKPTVALDDSTPAPKQAVEKLPEIDPALATISRCRVTRDVYTLFQRGTAPAPTPTPVPSASSRLPEVIDEEVYRTLEAASAAVLAIRAVEDRFGIDWKAASTPGQRALSITYLGNALGQMCSILNLIPVTPEVEPLMVELMVAVRARHLWVTDRLNLIQAGDIASSDKDVDGERNSGELDLALAQIIEARERLTATDFARQKELNSDVINISVELPVEMFGLRVGLDLVAKYNDYGAPAKVPLMGPDEWGLGQALRVRRIRNRGDFMPDNIVSEYLSLFVHYGDIDLESGPPPGALGDAKFEWLSFDGEWRGEVTLFVRDGFTYFVEYACRTANTAVVCRTLDQVAGSARYLE